MGTCTHPKRRTLQSSAAALADHDSGVDDDDTWGFGLRWCQRFVSLCCSVVLIAVPLLVADLASIYLKLI